MKMIKLLILMAVASSCSREITDFGAKLLLSWHASYEVTLHGSEYFNTNKKITRPFNTWQALVEIKTIDGDGSNSIRECLVYKVPYQKNLGVLRLISLVGTEKCQESYDKKPLMEINDLSSVKLYYGSEKISVKGRNRVIPPFSLGLNLEESWVTIPLLNIKGKRDLRKYSDGRIRSYNSGVMYWPYSDKRIDLKKRKSEQQFIGKLTDRYLDRTLVICEKVADDCKIIGENKCSRCRYGWFEVLGSKCKTNRIKFCRPNFCGERGEPACIRGDSYLGKQEEFGCIGGSKAGFCKSGLGTYCDGNGILICL